MKEASKYLGHIPWDDLSLGDMVESWRGRIGHITNLNKADDKSFEITWLFPMEGGEPRSYGHLYLEALAADEKHERAFLYRGPPKNKNN